MNEYKAIFPQRIIREQCLVTEGFWRKNGNEGVERKLQETREVALKLAKQLNYKNLEIIEQFDDLHIDAGWVEMPRRSPENWKDALCMSPSSSFIFTVIIDDTGK